MSDVASEIKMTAQAGATRARNVSTFSVAESSSETRTPACRLVLLGASNLTRGISTVVETAQNIHPQPLEILAAAGLGRSYGLDSRVLGRKLPGIIHCELWEKSGAAG